MIDRTRIMKALDTMPDEAFGWFVMACQPHSMVLGANSQIWPDGMGGFMQASRDSVAELRDAAQEYLTKARG
jgi:hypothetical protein